MSFRSSRAILTVAASAALLLTAPGLVGTAVAHNGNGPGGSSGPGGSTSQSSGANDVQREGFDSSLQNIGTPELQTAVKNAREAYKTAVRTAKEDFRNAVSGIRTSIQTETAGQLVDVQAKKKQLSDALAANADHATIDPLRVAFKASLDTYRTAWLAAKAKHQSEVDAAMAKAKSAIDTAAKGYAQAVTDAFAKYAPGATVPPGLLNPPGHAFGLGHGELDWNRSALRMHLRRA